MSLTGIPSVIHIIKSIPASIASIIAFEAAKGGT